MAGYLPSHFAAPAIGRQRPPFVQLSERRIGYRKSAVEGWLLTRTINRIGALASVKRGPPAVQAATEKAATVPASTCALKAPAEERAK